MPMTSAPSSEAAALSFGLLVEMRPATPSPIFSGSFASDAREGVSGAFLGQAEGDGLIAALAEMLIFRDQSDRVLTVVDAERLRRIRVFVRHSRWGGWRKGCWGFRPHQQESRNALRNLLS